MSNFYPQETFTLITGESKKVNIKFDCATSPAYYRSNTDFWYSGYPTSSVSYQYSTGKFSMTSNSSYIISTVTMTHKVTWTSKTFKMVIKPHMVMLGFPDTGHNHYSYMDNVQSNMGTNFSTYTKLQGSYTKEYILSTIDNTGNNVFVSRTHGGEQMNGGSVVTTAIYLDQYDDEVYLSGEDLYNSYTGGGANVDLTNMRLMVFCGCNTASPNVISGHYTLPESAVKCGAECAIGFSGTIVCESANDWTKKFFELLGDGMTVSQARSTMYSETESNGITPEIVEINRKSKVFGSSGIKLDF